MTDIHIRELEPETIKALNIMANVHGIPRNQLIRIILEKVASKYEVIYIKELESIAERDSIDDEISTWRK